MILSSKGMEIESFEEFYNRLKFVILASSVIRELLGITWVKKHDLLNGDLVSLQLDITTRLKEVMEDGEYDEECTAMIMKTIIDLRGRLLGITEIGYRDSGIE